MGRLIDLMNSDEPNSSIARYLARNGYEYETFVCGGNYGYQKMYEVDDMYCTYIHCDLEDRKLNIYKEYSCGGEVDSWYTSIPDELIEEDNVDEFMDWLDEESELYL